MQRDLPMLHGLPRLMLVIHVARNTSGHCPCHRVMVSVVTSDAAGNRAPDAPLGAQRGRSDKTGRYQNSKSNSKSAHRRFSGINCSELAKRARCILAPLLDDEPFRGQCPLSICGRPSRRKRYFEVGLAWCRMLPSVRPPGAAMRAAGPYGSSRIGTTSPYACLMSTVESAGSSDPVSPTVAPYPPSPDYAFDDLTPAAMPLRLELCNPRSSPAPPRRSARSCWRAPR